MKKTTLTLFAAAALLSPDASAADRYVRDGGSTNFATCGSDWADACDSLPPTLVRGDTYYIADGAYGSYAFDDPESGTAWIRVLKATEDDHGTSTGWQSSYGDGQAVFSGRLDYTRGYYELNGRRRNEADWQDIAAYGFVLRPAIGANSHAVTILPAAGTASQFRFEYLDMGGPPTAGDHLSVPDRALSIFGFRNIAISRCHMHHLIIPLLSTNGEDVVFEYNHIGPSWGKEAIRGNQGLNRWTVRHNRFVDNGINGEETLTADIAVWMEVDGTTSDWQIYGNLFLNTRFDINHNNGIIRGGASYSGPPPYPTYVYAAVNWKVYNNVFAGISGNIPSVLLQGGSGNAVNNNIWYDIKQPVYRTICGANDCRSNCCDRSIPPGAGQQHNCDILAAGTTGTVIGADDPFVDRSNGDFRLKDPAAMSGSSPVNAGLALGVGFDPVDGAGAVRGADGSWDMGLYERAGAGDAMPPARPRGLRIR